MKNISTIKPGGEIPFTQYLRPNGRPQPGFFSVDGDTYALARKIIEAGYVFEAEVLTTGEVSFTVSDGEEDYAIQVCPNGPETAQAIVTLTKEAAELLKIQ